MNTPQLNAAEAQPASRFASPLLPIFLIVVVDILGFTIVLPLLPFYAERLGASPTVVGTLVAIYAVCQLISGPILGPTLGSLRPPACACSSVKRARWLGFIMMALAGKLVDGVSGTRHRWRHRGQPEHRASLH